MANTSGNEPEKPPDLRKAAILMVMIGDEASGFIMRNLDENEVQEISGEIARVGSLTAQEAEDVLEEFYQMAVAHDYVVRGGIEYAKKILISAFGPDAAKNMLGRVKKTLGNETLSFAALQKADPGQLSQFLHGEHPQTIALILSHLNPPQAARLLFSLPAGMRSDIALRMAGLDQISPEIIAKIAKVLGSKLESLGEMNRESTGGVHAVAEMFNRLDPNSAQEILENIEHVNPGLVETIRHLMFVFEDLLLLDVNSVKEVLAKVDHGILTVALKGASEQMKNHVLQAMSQRGAEMLREDMEALGPIKTKEVEACRQQIIAVVRQLESEEVISLKGAAGEQYVV